MKPAISARVTVIPRRRGSCRRRKTYEVHPVKRGEFTGTDNVDYIMDKAPVRTASTAGPLTAT